MSKQLTTHLQLLKLLRLRHQLLRLLRQPDHVGLGRSNYCGGLYSGLRHFWHVHDCMECGVINALAHTVTIVRAGWSHSQEWLPCARILWDSLHRSRPNHTTQRDDGVARQERSVLQVNRLHSHLEQFSRMVRRGRLHMA